MLRPTLAASLGLAIAVTVIPSGRAPAAQSLPAYLRDRGTGVRTSLLGTYVRQGELLVYPFFEYYSDRNLEYKPSELGYGLNRDFRGRYHASEGILFFGYGITPDIALEFEGAVITAELQKSPSDTFTVPARVRESGLGDVEGQIRWRFQRETETRPEFFTYFGTVFPLQKSKKIIGTQHWEHFFGIGLVRGFRWGTLTVRTAAEYSNKVFDTGEYAFEYLRRLSPSWRIVAAIEGNQLDEIALLNEVQWFISPHAILKLNNALGLTTNAVDFAP
ncbi:MAG: hypothetical protein ACREMW_04350, partial [Gemmatimonadales bacterium]